jgi:hypothetical protein
MPGPRLGPQPAVAHARPADWPRRRRAVGGTRCPQRRRARAPAHAAGGGGVCHRGRGGRAGLSGAARAGAGRGGGAGAPRGGDGYPPAPRAVRASSHRPQQPARRPTHVRHAFCRSATPRPARAARGASWASAAAVWSSLPPRTHRSPADGRGGPPRPLPWSTPGHRQPARSRGPEAARECARSPCSRPESATRCVGDVAGSSVALVVGAPRARPRPSGPASGRGGARHSHWAGGLARSGAQRAGALRAQSALARCACARRSAQGGGRGAYAIRDAAARRLRAAGAQ